MAEHLLKQQRDKINVKMVATSAASDLYTRIGVVVPTSTHAPTIKKNHHKMTSSHGSSIASQDAYSSTVSSSMRSSRRVRFHDDRDDFSQQMDDSQGAVDPRLHKDQQQHEDPAIKTDIVETVSSSSSSGLFTDLHASDNETTTNNTLSDYSMPEDNSILQQSEASPRSPRHHQARSRSQRKQHQQQLPPSWKESASVSSSDAPPSSSVSAVSLTSSEDPTHSFAEPPSRHRRDNAVKFGRRPVSTIIQEWTQHSHLDDIDSQAEEHVELVVDESTSNSQEESGEFSGSSKSSEGSQVEPDDDDDSCSFVQVLVERLLVKKETEITLDVLWNMRLFKDKHSKALREFAKTNGCQYIVQAMKSNEESLTLQTKCCKLISALTFYHDGNKLAFHQAGAAETVVRAMNRFILSGELQKQGCGTLCNLSSLQSHRENVIKAGAVESILAAMKVHPQNQKLQTKACFCLYNLATGGEYIHKAMQQHSDSDLLQGKCCRVMSAMTYYNNELSEQAFGDQAEQASEQVVNAMLKFPKDATLQLFGCGALCNLASLPSQQASLIKVGGVDAVIAAIKLHPKDQEILLKACLCLYNLAASSEVYRKHIIQRSGGMVLAEVQVRLDDHKESPAKEAATLALINLYK